jgi:hypothetical protein
MIARWRIYFNPILLAPAIPNKSFSPPEQSSVVAMAM